MIEFGKIGEIIEGEYQGWKVLIQDQCEETGGYLIQVFRVKPGDPDGGFDYWVGGMDSLESFFRQAGWRVVWLYSEDEAKSRSYFQFY
jgi:hypothetical protein